MSESHLRPRPNARATNHDDASCRAQASAGGLRHLGAVEAAALDTALMSDKHGFSIDQLMELAGLRSPRPSQRFTVPPGYFCSAGRETTVATVSSRRDTSTTSDSSQPSAIRGAEGVQGPHPACTRDWSSSSRLWQSPSWRLSRPWSWTLTW